MEVIAFAFGSAFLIILIGFFPSIWQEMYRAEKEAQLVDGRLLRFKSRSEMVMNTISAVFADERNPSKVVPTLIFNFHDPAFSEVIKLREGDLVIFRKRKHIFLFPPWSNGVFLEV